MSPAGREIRWPQLNSKTLTSPRIEMLGPCSSSYDLHLVTPMDWCDVVLPPLGTSPSGKEKILSLAVWSLRLKCLHGQTSTQVVNLSIDVISSFPVPCYLPNTHPRRLSFPTKHVFLQSVALGHCISSSKPSQQPVPL
jgi:hypothetical protein